MEIAVLTLVLSLVRDPLFGSEAGVMFSRDLLWTNRISTIERTERAAFIVDEGGGNLQCLVWPATYQHARATFRGLIPRGTIAIIHTHPANAPWPSENDEREARRLGIPIYALTPLAITKAAPAKDAQLVERGPWLAPPSDRYRCKPIGSESASPATLTASSSGE
ncbi:MAG TPA: Mov34/MPN/PAD-1 family protein [Thermoanaerobaculia bacterium]|nr:Mov34/MPN/PAD-1 family protein [Thermoanaerobaculia bacterium]